MSFRYILRYYIDPLWDAEARIQELIPFCLAGGVEEVMLFVCPEELSAGHPVESEIEAHIHLGCKLRHALATHGIDLSLNPWSTIYHNPRGRRLREDQDFRLMVGDNGVESTVAVCPLCTQWQTYLTSTFSKLVQEIQPTVLWIEDDWRLRNHGSELGWGGCFCDEHLKRMESVCGRSFSREELLEEILRDPPNAVRRHWIALNRLSLLEPAAKLAAAIREANPETEIGLMSSSPDLHSMEGRDWNRLRALLQKDGRFLSRPKMPPYTEMLPMECPPSVTRLTIANVGRDSVIYPELENSPRCGIYSKSHRYSEWQMLHAAAMGSQGITMNHYDMLGNGISLDSQFSRPLARRKALLNAVTSLRLDQWDVSGLRVLFHPEVASHMQAGDGGQLDGLWHDSAIWGDVFFNLGIPWDFTNEIGSGAECTAVNGQTLRAFSKEDIVRLLSSNCMFDGDALRFLVENGYGDDVGVAGMNPLSLYEDAFSYERILSDLSAVGVPIANSRMTLQRCTHTVYDCEFLEGVEAVTEVRRADHKSLCAGSFLYRNKRGGVIFSLTYPLHRRNQLFMGFFNCFRQGLLQSVSLQLTDPGKFAVARSPGVQTYQYRNSDFDLLCGLNATADDLPSMQWLRRGEPWPLDGVEKLDADGTWNPLKISTSSLGEWHTMSCPVAVGHLDAFWMRLRRT